MSRKNERELQGSQTIDFLSELGDSDYDYGLDEPQADVIPLEGRAGSLHARLFEKEVWMKDANCRGTKTSLFYPERGESSKQAKNVCEECVVTIECSEYSFYEKFGTWAGRSEQERRSLRKESKDTDEPTSQEIY
jgi:WhiB family redox-sensing transcriptional regulator